MVKRKRKEETEEILEDATQPDEKNSELMAALDQHEAEMRGEANIPPSQREPEPEPEPDPVVEPAESKPKVKLRVFLATAGKKWDQMAGFKSFAIRNKLGPLSIPEWRKAFTDFMNRAVG